MIEEECVYCTGNPHKRKPLMKNQIGDYFVIINRFNYLEDSVIGGSVDYSLYGVKIKHCPMCARELG